MLHRREHTIIDADFHDCLASCGTLKEVIEMLTQTLASHRGDPDRLSLLWDQHAEHGYGWMMLVAYAESEEDFQKRKDDVRRKDAKQRQDVRRETYERLRAEFEGNHEPKA